MYNSAGGATAQTITGSAFIVYTMLGNNGAGYSRTVSGSDWSTLTDRMNASNINWGGNIDNFSGSRNVDSFYAGPMNTPRGSAYDDNEFYSNNQGPEPGIRFMDGSGRTTYLLFRWCANPAGGLSGLPITWNISVGSAVSGPNASGILTWTHTVSNSTGQSPNITYHYQNRGDLGGGSGPNNVASFSSNQTRTFASTYRILSSDAGKNLCRATSAIPHAWNDGGWTESGAACYRVPYNYSLVPSVSTNTAGVIETGTAINVNPNVNNSGPTRSAPTQWQLTKSIVLPNNTIPNSGGGISPKIPCDYFGSASSNCSVVSSGANTYFYLGNSPLATFSDVAGDYAAGTRICFALSVQPYATSIPAKGTDSQWSHSVPVCMVIGKRPKVQIWGGNLLAGGSVGTGTSAKNISGTVRTFGSWDEYGIFSAGAITGMASGSAFSGPGLVSSSVCDYSTLSFTNAGAIACTASTTKGNYTTSGSLPDIAASFPGGVTIPSNTIVANDLLGGSGVYVGNLTGNLTLNSSQLNPGKSIILKVSGTVTIAGDQTYNADNNGAKYNFISQLPQLVIVANKIIINDSVTNVDGWLVASGTDGIVETCNTGSLTYDLVGNQKLTTNKCSSLLTVNGPVIAKQLWLRRTAGSGPGAASGDPAEVFNLRADTYLWATARAISGSRIQTVYSTELPPRF
jgi:hypothetical protein